MGDDNRKLQRLREGSLGQTPSTSLLFLWPLNFVSTFILGSCHNSHQERKRALIGALITRHLMHGDAISLMGPVVTCYQENL